MGITLITDIPCTINTGKLLKSLQPGIQKDAAGFLKETAEKASAIAHPRALISLEQVTEITAETVSLGDTVFTSPLLAELTRGHTMLAPFLATSGHELEDWSESVKDLLLQYVINEIKNQVLIGAINQAKKQLQQNTGWNDISVISPGSIIDWGPEDQSLIVSLFKEHIESAGMYINEYHVLYPPSSLSGILFNCSESEGFCSFCQDYNCPHRAAPPHKLLKK